MRSPIGLGLGLALVVTAVAVAQVGGPGIGTSGLTRNAGAVFPVCPSGFSPDQIARAFTGLSLREQCLYVAGLARFNDINSVSGTIAGEPDSGLGPRFNLNSCAGCHAQPATGGTSPAVNPQIAVATLDGATNVVPSFITLSGPVREARFIRNPDTSPDGSVHDLYTIAGRTDAPGCSLSQPDFASAIASSNVIFRIPTPLFGLGLVENTPDNNLEAAAAAQSGLRASLGISTRFNTSGNTQNLTRFGWKAQNPSLTVFAGEAYNVEMGVTNDIFPDKRDTTAGCQFDALPEDTNTGLPNPQIPQSVLDGTGDIGGFTLFMRLLAPLAPLPPSGDVARGQTVFNATGCQACHIPQQTTGLSDYGDLSIFTYSPYSDFGLHNMGTGLADGVSQGNAGPQDFRTAPLWGVGQRLFFLHDGRETTLTAAILDHASSGSEANAVIANFNALSGADQAALLAFLNSL
jgi:CxxC motif-containing protein (DUF1111 family)